MNLVDDWEQGLYEMLEGDLLEKTQKIKGLMGLPAYEFFDSREKHRVEMEKLKAHYEKMRAESKKRK